MKKIMLTVISICCLSYMLKAQSNDTLSTYVLLKGATIIDCIADNPQRGDLLIKNQKIEQIS